MRAEPSMERVKYKEAEPRVLTTGQQKLWGYRQEDNLFQLVILEAS